LVLKSGRVLEFIHTPYLHSPGAIVTYDTKSRSLFTSDLFGGMSNNWSLFAEDGYLDAIDAFHQVYMPSNQVLRSGLERLEKLDIQRILPQHGSVIENERISEAFAHLKELKCGVDLMEENKG
jgi:flavorubredoxin